ncbi:GtrA family protein, partial [Yersinia sp. 1252 StPb PI]|uniref:GtrA family protein n=1 Tax=Yersinia sp. 1252 StPb PI TaxID=3117404 RepID=UPI003B285F58
MQNKSIIFIIVSGFGWILDVLVMASLVHNGVVPGVANMISAGTAITFVYWISRVFIFQKKADRRGGLGYVIYCCYSVIVILVFSALIQYISLHLYGYFDYKRPLSLLAVVEKIMVT